MDQIIGVTELQRRFRAVFDDVTRNRIPYILMRGSKPQAVLIPYEEYIKYQTWERESENQRYERVMRRMQELNAHYSDEEIEADVEAAIQKCARNAAPEKRRGRQNMRVAVDTNVFISTVIKPENRVGMIVVRMRNGEYTLLYAEEMLDELVEVITRDKIWKRYELTEETVNTFVNSIVEHGEKVEVVTVLDVCRDPDDNILLALALDGKADYIVSGDKDLLELTPFQGIPIVAPAEFLAMF
jgi:conserved hypothetical protein TIGR00305